MSEYKIEKGVPLPPKQTAGIYAYLGVPFDKMEVDDCVTLPLDKMIPHNPHPDGRERSLFLSSMCSYLIRKFPDKKFTYRMDKPVFGLYRNKEVKQANLTRCVRVWRIK